jgi:ammonium transporter, Amt family
MFISYARGGKWDLGITTNGFLAGLVAITCPCYWVDPIGAFFVGIIGAVAMVAGTELLEWLRIDDPIGAVPVHMFAGMAGTMSLGLFAAGKYGAPTATGVDLSSVVTGLFYGGGVDQLWIQFYGTVTVALAVFVVSMVLMYAVKATGTLRVSQAGELEGLDIHEHGVAAYPEFVTAWGKGLVVAPPVNGTDTPAATPRSGQPVSAG